MPIRIGAATRMQTAGSSALLKEKARAVAQAAGKLASPPVRTLATLGGNLCTASPAADCGCALLGLDAEVVLTRLDGQRDCAAQPVLSRSKPDRPAARRAADRNQGETHPGR